MPYRVSVLTLVQRLLARWQLSPAVEGEVYVRLRGELPRGAPAILARTTDPFDGMTYSFRFIDPDNRMMVHRFIFHVMFGMDEETLFVVNAAYLRGIGF